MIDKTRKKLAIKSIPKVLSMFAMLLFLTAGITLAASPSYPISGSVDFANPAGSPVAVGATLNYSISTISSSELLYTYTLTNHTWDPTDDGIWNPLGIKIIEVPAAEADDIAASLGTSDPKAFWDGGSTTNIRAFSYSPFGPSDTLEFHYFYEQGDTLDPGKSFTFYLKSTKHAGIATFKIWDGGNSQDATSNSESAAVMGPVGNDLSTPDIAVHPDPPLVDFGFVEVGTTVTTEVTISNAGTGDLTVSDIFLEDGSGDFSITSIQTLPMVVPSDGLAIQIAYAPSTLGYSSTDLVIISDDPDENQIGVQLEGTGVWENLPTSEQISYILSFLDESIAQGTLVGCGKSLKRASRRLKFMRQMLKAASSLIERGWMRAACLILKRVHVRADGSPRPHDFVKGDARPLLAEMIVKLRENLGCQVSCGTGLH